MKKEEMAKVSGGWSIAPNGSYFFSLREVNKLKNQGFEIAEKGLKGWDGVESGGEIGQKRNRVVNYNGERATPEQIAKVLGEPSK